MTRLDTFGILGGGAWPLREEKGAFLSKLARFLQIAGFLEVDALGIGEALTLVDRRVAQGQRGVVAKECGMVRRVVFFYVL